MPLSHQTTKAIDFLYRIFTLVRGNEFSYIFLNTLRKFEKYDWHCPNESRKDQSIVWILDIYRIVRASFIIRMSLYSSSMTFGLFFHDWYEIAEHDQ